MKKNKNRWREMKDEKPKLDSVIHIFGCNDSFFTGFYAGINGNSDEFFMIDVNGRGRNEYNINEFKWRKMCKLPGDK